MGEKQQEPSKPLGNLLGEGRAEIDNKMLAEAFVKTSDYQALTSTFDFNFVVGRRGTGKTALFIKVAEYFKTQPHQLFLHEIRPDEAEALLLRSVLEKHSSDYRTIRAITRVSWRAHLLLTVLTDLISHWRFSRVAGHDYLRQYSESHKKLVKEEGLRRCADIVRQFSQNIETAREIPGAIATALDLENLQRAIQEALVTLKRSAVFMFDGLDEGWEPTGLATAIIGGLALAVADFRDKKSGIRGILFLRDNIFRALAHLDPDFSRHIEGSALRLHWENDALLQLVVSRLRIRLELEHIESSIRIWNRFAQRKLQDRQGFSYCLRYTLRRPRDILVLLNQTFLLAS